jgi:hypothetical protein
MDYQWFVFCYGVIRELCSQGPVLPTLDFQREVIGEHSHIHPGFLIENLRKTPGLYPNFSFLVPYSFGCR